MAIELTPERLAELEKTHNHGIASLSNDELREIEYIDFIENRFGPGYTSEELSTMEFPDPVWIVDRMIPEGLTVFYAKPKLGKSFFALQILRIFGECLDAYIFN